MSGEGKRVDMKYGVGTAPLPRLYRRLFQPLTCDLPLKTQWQQTGAAKLGRLIAEQLALHAAPHRRVLMENNAFTFRISFLLTIGERESFGGPNRVLCAPYLTALLGMNDSALVAASVGPGTGPRRRQPLNLCGPLDGKIE